MLTARPGTRSARARLSHALNAARAIPLLLLVVVGPACDSFGSSPSAARSSPTPEPVDVLPPPGPPSPVPVPVGPRPVEPLAVPASPGPGLATDATVASTGERVRVVNTEGQGANLRAEPRGGADRVKTIREGAELEIVGADREADGRRWRNVREGTDGARGWVVADLLAAPSPAAVEVAGEARRPAASPSPRVPQAAGRVPQVGGADRAYAGALQGGVEALGKAIGGVSRQLEVAGGRPAAVEDPGWRSATEATAGALSEAARRIRALEPGPSTGHVHERAVRAAGRADEAAQLLAEAAKGNGARGLGPIRTAVLRVVSEINAMNGALLELQ